MQEGRMRHLLQHDRLPITCNNVSAF